MSFARLMSASTPSRSMGTSTDTGQTGVIALKRECEAGVPYMKLGSSSSFLDAPAPAFRPHAYLPTIL